MSTSISVPLSLTFFLSLLLSHHPLIPSIPVRKVSEYDNHLSSYDHHHRKRLKDLRDMERQRKAGQWILGLRQERERRKIRGKRKARHTTRTQRESSACATYNKARGNVVRKKDTVGE